ncbi:DNA cytosine methyltransferase [Catenulispora sp. NF23]|nr:DNA cytosine methyltransferase [Catenulispora pinistramenti]
MTPARASSAPRLGSLCTGYGGLDLAAKAVFGARPAWFADNDPDAVRVLKHHHRRVPNLGDITGLDFADRKAVPGVDILTAGWPCQDISIAGRGEGLKKGNRSGLWFTVAAAVRDLRPDLVLLENVAQLRGRGLDRVQADLAGSGYHTEWLSLRAAEVGAPHRRARMFILAWRPGEPADRLLEAAAHSAGPGRRRAGSLRSCCAPGRGSLGGPRRRGVGAHGDALGGGAVPDSAGVGRHEGLAEPARVQRGSDAHLGDREAGPASGRARRGPARSGLNRHSDFPWGVYADAVRRWEHIVERPAPDPTEPGRNGRPRLRPEFTAWVMGLPADDYLAGVPDVSRIAALRLAGNGVVPQHAETAFRELARRACGCGRCDGTKP